MEGDSGKIGVWLVVLVVLLALALISYFFSWLAGLF